MPRRDLLVLALAMVILLGGTTWQSYEGRVKLRGDAVNGCLRSQLDRAGLAELNDDVGSFATDASRARRADGNAATADRYMTIAGHTSERSKDLRRRLPPALECDKAFPHPSLFPWAG